MEFGELKCNPTSIAIETSTPIRTYVRTNFIQLKFEENVMFVDF